MTGGFAGYQWKEMTTNPTEKGERHEKEKEELKSMNKNKTHLKKFRGNRVLLLASKIFFVLNLFILFSLTNAVWAYEQDRKALKEENLTDFPKQAAAAPFSYNQLQTKDFIFGIKMNFEINTIWSKPKNKLKSPQLVNKFFGENDFSMEFPLDEKIPVGATPAKLFEIRF